MSVLGARVTNARVIEDCGIHSGPMYIQLIMYY